MSAHLSRIGFTWLDELCLLILALSLCNELSLGALVLDSLSSAQSLILDVLILLLCNGPLVSVRQTDMFI